jgi:hypothetical protein
MKKFLLLLALFFTLPCFAMDLKTFDVRQTYFKNDIKTYNNDRWGFLSFKGVWTDPQKYVKSVKIEEVICQINANICESALVDINFIGTPTLAPYIDVNQETYKIIDISSIKMKLFSPVTNYTIDIDLQKQKITKYKVFDNGDINKYNMTFDYEQAKQYFKSIIPE